MSARLIILGLILVGLFAGSYLAFGQEMESWLAGPRAVETLRGYGPWAWAVAMGLLVADVLLPVPASAVLATLGMIYGPFLGGLIGAVGSFLAGALAYLACRSLGQRAALFLIGADGLGQAQRFFAQAGGWVVALSRWMIILPELVGCLAGLTRMDARHYFTALTCGTLPMAFTYAAVGAAGSDRPLLAICISAAVPVALWPVAMRILSRPGVDGQKPRD